MDADQQQDLVLEELAALHERMNDFELERIEKAAKANSNLEARVKALEHQLSEFAGRVDHEFGLLAGGE
jgi:uncharacterized protein YceH (UPF0502 family)